MFFNQGQFNIKQSWGNDDQSTSNELNKDPRPPINNEKQKKKNSHDILDVLDDELAKKILKDFQGEGGFKSLEPNIFNNNKFRKRESNNSIKRKPSCCKTL